jgi:hypothetical protein
MVLSHIQQFLSYNQPQEVRVDASITVIVAVLTTFIASGGFWTYLSARREKKSATTRLLMGLAYDKIASRGMMHIVQGSITEHEYEEFRRYLYEPYKELGGNGTAERIMQEVSTLPLRRSAFTPHKKEEQ